MEKYTINSKTEKSIAKTAKAMYDKPYSSVKGGTLQSQVSSNENSKEVSFNYQKKLQYDLVELSEETLKQISNSQLAGNTSIENMSFCRKVIDVMCSNNGSITEDEIKKIVLQMDGRQGENLFVANFEKDFKKRITALRVLLLSKMKIHLRLEEKEGVRYYALLEEEKK